MKKSILTVLFALICTMGFSQVSFNVKAGLNLSSYIGENSGLSCNSWGITLCNFPFMHTPLLIYTGRTSYLPLHEMKP